MGGTAAFCVNWVNVGYFSQHVDKLNSFQLLLIDQGSGNFDIEFNYDKVNWETGDASGGSNGFGGSLGRGRIRERRWRPQPLLRPRRLVRERSPG